MGEVDLTELNLAQLGFVAKGWYETTAYGNSLSIKLCSSQATALCRKGEI